MQIERPGFGSAEGLSGVKWRQSWLAVAVACVTVALTLAVVSRHRDRPLIAVVVGLTVLTAGYLAHIDFQQHRLPNRITGPLAMFATVGLTACGFLYDVAERTLPAIGFGVGSFFFFLFLHLLVNLGMGDVKYAYTVGFVSGWFGLSTLMAAFLLTSIAAAAAAIVTVVATKNSKRFIAYGPYLSLGLAVALL